MTSIRARVTNELQPLFTAQERSLVVLCTPCPGIFLGTVFGSFKLEPDVPIFVILNPQESLRGSIMPSGLSGGNYAPEGLVTLVAYGL